MIKLLEWKKHLHFEINDRIRGLKGKTIVYLIIVMTAYTTADFYLNGFNFFKLIILEIMSLAILVDVKIFKI